MSDTKLVRIKKGKKGFPVQRYVIKGKLFKATDGWYEVDASLAAELATLHASHYDEESPLLFQVCTREEAERIDEAEAKKAEKASARAPKKAETTRIGTLTTDDLKGEPSFDEAFEAAEAEAEPPAMLDPDPEGKELEAEEGLVAVGRAAPEPKAEATKPKGKARSKKS